MQIQAVVKKYDILFIADEVLIYFCLNWMSNTYRGKLFTVDPQI